MPIGSIREKAREIPLHGECDVVVLGGGPAGIAAAAAAARSGRSTVLVERYGFLGGAGTAAGLSNFCGLHANVRGEHRQVVRGIACEIQDRLRGLNGLNEPHTILGNRIQAQAYDISAYKIAADELLAAAGVKTLFHALGAGVAMDSPRRIDALILESKSGRRGLRARWFIDASGDADLAAWAGVRYEVGDANGNMLYPSTMFRINGVDPDKAGHAWDSIAQRIEDARRSGRSFPRKDVILRPQKNPIEWRANVTQVRNPDGSAVSGIDLEQMSYGEIEGRRQCKEMFEFIRGAPGFERAYIVEIAPQLGIRETRRIAGEYALSESDILDCADFDDTIGVQGWPIEQHAAGKVDWRFQKSGLRGYNQMPYRMIVPKGVENLLVAGRCASMTHDGQSAARVSGPCFVMGQAAGVAASLALSANCAAAAVDVGALQRRLAADGVNLTGD
jgi:FAD-dependent oxidoreductase family protein